MLQLPKHFHPDFRQPGVKPVGPVEIDWTHPLADGLLFYFIGDQDLVSGNRAEPVAAYSATQSARNYGRRGFEFESHSTTDGGFGWEYTDIDRIDGSSFFTIAIELSTDSKASDATLLASPAVKDGPRAFPWVGIGLTSQSTDTSLKAMFANGGSETVISDDGAILLDSVPHMYSVSKNDTTTGIFYRDGEFFSSNTNAGFDGVVNPTNSAVFTMSSDWGAVDTGVNGRAGLGAIWARELDAGEHRAFYADPFALLKPKTLPLYFTVSALPEALDNDLISAMHFQRHYEPIPAPAA